MSLNILTDEKIKGISNVLLDLIKEEEAKTRKDMKLYLNKTSLSKEEKVKEYSAFSMQLFSTKLNAVLTTSQQYLVQDAQLSQQDEVNKAQINLTNAQKALAEEEKLVTTQKKNLAEKEVLKATEDIKTAQLQQYLMSAEAQAKITNIVATTMTEARRNGASITKDIKTVTLPTGQQLSYGHLSLAAVNATDTSTGEIGKRMALWEKQTKSFDKHAKVSTLGQYINLLGIALDSGASGIDGLLTTVKTIADDVTELNTSSITNVTAG